MQRERGAFLPALGTVFALLLLSCTPPASQSIAPGAATAKPPESAPAPPAKLPSPTVVPKLTSAEQSRYGGVLTISTTGDPYSLDMQQDTSYLLSNVVQAGYNGVTQFNPDSPEEIIRDLAKSWEVSKDGLTYTFDLHQNVKFHDGASFTAEDARFSFERMVRPPTGVLSPRRPDLAMIDKVEAPDKDTVKFILKYPSAAFVDVISSGWMVIYSRAFVEKKGHMKNDVMGTGPYSLKNYSAGISLEYVKNQGYFVKGRPHVDGIIFYIIKDSGTRLAAFRTGQVKLTGPGESGLNPASAEVVRRTLPQAVIVSYPSIANDNFIMNTTEKPWSDIRVRKAVHLAIDRQNAIIVLGEGYGQVGSNMPGKWGIPKEELEKMPGWRQPKDADVAEAKRLLAEAGYPNGFTIRTLVRAEKTFEQLSVYMADQLARIGIKLELDVKDAAVRTRLLTQGAFSSHAMMNSFAYPDPQNLVRLWAPPIGADWGSNWPRYHDERISELFDKQSGALDPKERARIVRELDLLMIDVAVRPVVWWKQYLLGMWPEVRGRGKLIGSISFQKYQDVWLAK
ncbi:MAG: ABC transporter substrate-binding protein [Chloroflexi bacterium]|nr:ABC transporter substrate-binding protein [Chloroflexota bacterium]